MQYICFQKTSNSNKGGAKPASCAELHLTSLRPCQVVLLNANGISGKAADELHIYLHFNETSEFGLISPVYQRFVLNLLLRTAENFSNLNQSGATSFCFQSISWTKMLVRMCTSFHSWQIFSVLGSFHRARIARNSSRQKHQEMKKTHQISLSMLNLFSSQWVHNLEFSCVI